MIDTIHKFRKALSDAFDGHPFTNKFSISEEDLNDKRPVKVKKFRLRNQTSHNSLVRQ